jgi:chemotaxis protein CheX
MNLFRWVEAGCWNDRFTLCFWRTYTLTARETAVKAEYINAFVESIGNVFEMMLSTPLQRRQLRASTTGFERVGETLTSVIGISGKASGVVALVFPNKTAMELAKRFLGCEVNDENGAVTDALAELVNMVGGSAKAKFNLDPPPELSLPTVIAGHDYKMRYPTKSAWFEVPFSSNAGDFVMELSFCKD